MTQYVPYRSASFLGPINEVHHLFAVLNHPCVERECLLVNVTSIKPAKYFDPACVLDVGDHPFIQHPSYMLYRLANTMAAGRITKMVGLKYYLTREDWGSAVFQRILDGIRASDDTPKRIINYADANGIA